MKESIPTWSLDEKPIDYKISDIYTWIITDEWILMDKLNAKTYVEVLYMPMAFPFMNFRRWMNVNRKIECKNVCQNTLYADGYIGWNKI